MNTDPQAAAAAWAAGMANAGTKMTAGINAVQTPPGQLAARSADLWASNVAAAKSKFAKNSAAVSLESWKQSAIQKGIPRVASGASAAQPKMAAAMQQILPQIATIVANLPARGNTDQNIARAVAYMQAARKIQYTPS